MEFKSIAVALILLAVLFGWYVWLEASERRRRRAAHERTPDVGAGEGRRAGEGRELWRAE